jgi:hypothetical protein
VTADHPSLSLVCFDVADAITLNWFSFNGLVVVYPQFLRAGAVAIRFRGCQHRDQSPRQRTRQQYAAAAA